MQALEECGCEETAVYELLRTGMVGEPAQVFTRYHGKSIIRIRFHVYGEKGKLIKVVIGYDANGLYIHCLGNVMRCGGETLAVNRKPYDQKRIAKFSKDLLKGKVFGFMQVDIEVTDELYGKFSEMPPLFVVQEIPDCAISVEIKIFKEKLEEKQ